MTNTTKPKRIRRFARTPDVEAQVGGDAATAPVAPTQPVPEPVAKPESKASRIVSLMQREEGATLEEMVAATNWLPHTARAALTGLKRKGHTITSVKAEGVRRYHAVAPR
jgi:hypothetical protein